MCMVHNDHNHHSIIIISVSIWFEKDTTSRSMRLLIKSMCNMQISLLEEKSGNERKIDNSTKKKNKEKYIGNRGILITTELTGTTPWKQKLWEWWTVENSREETHSSN